MIQEIEDDALAVGGLTLGADPLVCGVAQRAYYSGHRHVDALIVRKNPKGYGTKEVIEGNKPPKGCLLYTSPSPRDATLSRMPSSA